MAFFRNLFKERSAAAPSRPNLKENEVYDIVQDFFIKDRNPTNQQIADILERTIEEVNVIRPPGPYVHTRYDGEDDGKPLYNDHERRQKIIDNFMEETKALKTDGAIFKAINDERQRESTTQQQKINTGLRLPGLWLPVNKTLTLTCAQLMAGEKIIKQFQIKIKRNIKNYHDDVVIKKIESQ
jgi:hypothetical protein